MEQVKSNKANDGTSFQFFTLTTDAELPLNVLSCLTPWFVVALDANQYKEESLHLYHSVNYASPRHSRKT
jgi:hypothetical protein